MQPVVSPPPVKIVRNNEEGNTERGKKKEDKQGNG
jgi:hypothetical protein